VHGEVASDGAAQRAAGADLAEQGMGRWGWRGCRRKGSRRDRSFCAVVIITAVSAWYCTMVTPPLMASSKRLALPNIVGVESVTRYSVTSSNDAITMGGFQKSSS
jgi:hypothetical protein